MSSQDDTTPNKAAGVPEIVVDPVGDTVSGLTRDELLGMVNTMPNHAAKVDPLSTTQPDGLSRDDVDAFIATNPSSSSERVTARVRTNRVHARAETEPPVKTEPAKADEAAKANEPAKADANPLASTVRNMASPVAKRSVTYPPSTWDRQNEVLTSAQREHMSPSAEHFAGQGIEPGNMRVSEDTAREVITSRFAAAGVALEADFPFRHKDLMVTLDGYDATRHVGFAFLSHSDADVVTDFDEATEFAFAELAGSGVAWVLVLHDSDVPVVPALHERIDKFLAALPSA